MGASVGASVEWVLARNMRSKSSCHAPMGKRRLPLDTDPNPRAAETRPATPARSCSVCSSSAGTLWLRPSLGPQRQIGPAHCLRSRLRLGCCWEIAVSTPGAVRSAVGCAILSRKSVVGSDASFLCAQGPETAAARASRRGWSLGNGTFQAAPCTRASSLVGPTACCAANRRSEYFL